MLHYTIDEEAFNGLPDAVKAEYKKDDASGKYKLDVSGAVPATKLEEFRLNNVELKKKLEAFEGVDVTKYGELLKIETDLRSGKVKDGKTVEQIVEERVDAMKKAHERETAKLKGDLESSTRELSRVTIGEAALAAGQKHGLRSTAADDLRARVGATFRLKDGKPVAFNGETEIYGAGGDPMTIDEYVTALVEKAPHLFEKSDGTGAQGNRGGNTGPQVNPWDPKTKNVTKQGELMKANPALAKSMAAKFGVHI